MPRLNSLGSALMGVAGGITSIDGAIPPSLASSQGAGWDWLDDDTIIGQSLISGILAIYQVIVTPDTLSTVVVEGANNIQAGGGVWEKWWTNGVTTNVVAVPSLPNAGTGDVDFDGTWCVCTTYATGSGITVYDPIGTVLQQINVSLNGAIRLRDGWLTYNTQEGWPIVDSLTGSALPGYLKQQHVSNLIVFGATQPGVLEYNSDTAQFSVRRADQGTGLLLPISATMFGVDAVRLVDGTVRVAWSTGAGELPGELVVMDIDTETGTTEVGTVVGSTLVFATGPTLEGSRFRLVASPVVYPPYKDEMNVTQTIAGQTKKTISQPWVRYLNSQSQGVSSLQAAAASLAPPIPPSTFQASVLVSDTMGAAGFPQARTVEDSATVTWDYSVPGVATANAVGTAVECYVPMTTGAIPGEILFVGPDVMLMKVPVV